MDISNNVYDVVSYNWQDKCYISDTVLIRMSNADPARILFTQGNLVCVYWENWKSIEYLVLNKGVGNYFVLDKDKVLPTVNRSCQLFISVCHSRKFIGYVIPKNACSTIVSTALLLDHGHWLDEPWDHMEWHKKVLIYPEDYHGERYSDYLHYTIYRDPVERFINYCNYTYTKKSYLVAPYAHPGFSKRDFICSLITMAGVVAPRGKWESHLQTQTHYIRMMPQIDCIVPIRNFADFQQNILKLDEPLKANVSSEKVITAADFTEEQLEEIKNIYREDYNLPRIYGDRLYKPGH